MQKSKPNFLTLQLFLLLHKFQGAFHINYLVIQFSSNKTYLIPLICFIPKYCTAKVSQVMTKASKKLCFCKNKYCLLFHVCLIKENTKNVVLTFEMTD